MKFGGIDLETTGLLDPAHRIIECHISKYDDSYSLIGEKTWRIHPDRSIDAKAQAVHHISLDDLAGCPKLEAVVDEIIDYMRDVDLWVAHNGETFDKPFIKMELARVKPAAVPWLDRTKWFDTMLDGRWATAWGKVPNLGELAFASDVEYDPTKAHAASYDVHVHMQSFFFGLKTGFYKI